MLTGAPLRFAPATTGSSQPPRAFEQSLPKRDDPIGEPLAAVVLRRDGGRFQHFAVLGATVGHELGGPGKLRGTIEAIVFDGPEAVLRCRVFSCAKAGEPGGDASAGERLKRRQPDRFETAQRQVDRRVLQDLGDLLLRDARDLDPRNVAKRGVLGAEQVLNEGRFSIE